VPSRYGQHPISPIPILMLGQPASALNIPAEQLRHADALSYAENVPAAQAVQLTPPDAVDVPAVPARQTVGGRGVVVSANKMVVVGSGVVVEVVDFGVVVEVVGSGVVVEVVGSGVVVEVVGSSIDVGHILFLLQHS
jgi:hypothetical protein